MAAIVEPVKSAQSALPVCLCSWLENPYRLVSLLDIVKLLRAERFLKISAWAALEELKGQLPKNELAKDPSTPGHPREVLGEERRIIFEESFSQFANECLQMGLDASVTTVTKILNVLKRTDCEFRELAPLATELQGRLIDEMSGKYFFSLTMAEAEHYNKPTEGWGNVTARFPAATTDIEEMNKCYALSRYAASVFHSTQAIECGLIEFGKFLKVNDPKSGWTAVTSRLAALVTKTKYQDIDPLYQKHFQFLEQMHGTVAALSSAWRNKISHAQARLILMTSEFSSEVAEEIMIASRSFMRRLATELPVVAETCDGGGLPGGAK